MILETAVLDVIPDQTSNFERDFAEAQRIIVGMPGYLGHELHRCIERTSRYLLLVRWDTLLDHTEGFRGSLRYEDWKRLLHHYYDPFPVVEHYSEVTPPLER